MEKIDFFHKLTSVIKMATERPIDNISNIVDEIDELMADTAPNITRIEYQEIKVSQRMFLTICCFLSNIRFDFYISNHSFIVSIAEQLSNICSGVFSQWNVHYGHEITDDVHFEVMISELSSCRGYCCSMCLSGSEIYDEVNRTLSVSANPGVKCFTMCYTRSWVPKTLCAITFLPTRDGPFEYNVRYTNCKQYDGGNLLNTGNILPHETCISIQRKLFKELRNRVTM